MKEFVLVAHGAPSDPEGPDAWLKALAERVSAFMPDCLLRGATLAKPGSLATALTGLRAPAIYPFFMAEGWFTREELPRRLAALGVDAPILSPFGTDPELPALIAEVTSDAARSAGIEPESTDLLLAAHGSRRAHRSKDSAHAMAERLRRITPFARVRVGLIEEPPFLEKIATDSREGVCLPFFALRAGHVATDIPEALAKAGFRGALLPAIGEHAEVPPMIARALLRFGTPDAAPSPA